jgi:hypothetical protein
VLLLLPESRVREVCAKDGTSIAPAVVGLVNVVAAVVVVVVLWGVRRIQQRNMIKKINITISNLLPYHGIAIIMLILNG